MLKDRLNEAQKSNISNICKKIVPTEKGFDNHTANLHTKKSPGWGITGIENHGTCRPVFGNGNVVLNNCNVCGLIYNNV